jgi:hypothetical protein
MASILPDFVSFRTHLISAFGKLVGGVHCSFTECPLLTGNADTDGQEIK